VLGKKWRYCKPAVGKNGKIKPDWVIVRGKEEHHPEGNFYLHRYDGNKEIWKRIGPNAQEAVNAADFESTYLAARAKGIPVKPIDTPILSVKAAAHGWLEDVKLSNRPETYELYEHTIRQFQEWNLNGGPHRINLIDLDRKDVLEYRKWLLDVEKNSARTAGNKLTRVSQWYRDSLKLKPGEGLITTRDTRLGVTDREPETYTAEELKKLFKACVTRWPAEQILFRTFLVTGFREDEIRFLTWADLDWKNHTIKVTPKPEYDFVIKDHEERTVPVPPWGTSKVSNARYEMAITDPNDSPLWMNSPYFSCTRLKSLDDRPVAATMARFANICVFPDPLYPITALILAGNLPSSAKSKDITNEAPPTVVLKCSFASPE
jgi:integrase/recombinase XerD